MQGQSPELQAKFKELIDLRKRYNEKNAAVQKAQEAIPAELLKATKGQMGTDEAAVYAAIGKIADQASFDTMVQNNPTLIPDVLDDFSGKELQKAIGEFAKKGIKITVKQEAGFSAFGGKPGIYEYNGKTYTTKKDTATPKGRNAGRGQMGRSQPGGDAGGTDTAAGGSAPPAPAHGRRPCPR